MSRNSSPTFDVNGRTVFITGAARGIGAATAERLYAKGANVALVGLEPERLEALAERLGDRAEAIEADVSDFDALERAVSRTVARFGGIDVAVANAGIAFTGSLADRSGGAGRAHARRELLGRVAHRSRSYRPDHRAPRLPAEHLLAVGRYARADDGSLHRGEGWGRGVDRRAEDGDLPQWRAVGCAYFGFIDTDLVRASFAQPSAQAAHRTRAGVHPNPAPLPKAIDAIERGIERRSERVWAPRWVGPMIALRGFIQPLTERQTLNDPSGLTEAMRLAESAGKDDAVDPLLGIAAKALQKTG